MNWRRILRKNIETTVVTKSIHPRKTIRGPAINIFGTTIHIQSVISTRSKEQFSQSKFTFRERIFLIKIIAHTFALNTLCKFQKQELALIVALFTSKCNHIYGYLFQGWRLMWILKTLLKMTR